MSNDQRVLVTAGIGRAKHGTILVMSSLAGRFGYPYRSPYATSKWGLIGFTKTLSRFFAPEEIGALAVFLASDAARSISGQIVPIDGDSQSAS